MATLTQRTESIFRSPSFTRFYIGQVFSYLGYGLRLIAIPLLVYRLTHSASALGATYACELAPFSLFGVIGGSLADRIDRRRLMIVCDAIRIGVLTLFAVAFALNVLTIPMLLIGIAIESTAAAGFINAQTTSIRYLLGPDRATPAIAALIAAEQVSTTVLPPVGGALFAFTGPLPALIVNALTYAVSLGAIAGVATFGPDRAVRPERGAIANGLTLRTVASDVREGFAWLGRDDAMRTVTALSFCFNFFGFMVGATLIPFLKNDFGASDHIVGYAFGLGAIGSVLGSFVAGRVPKAWRFGPMLIVAYALDGLLFVPVMFTHALPVAILFLALTNACVMFEIAQIVGWRIRITPEAILGRVTSAARLVATIGTVPGALLGGYLADRYGARMPIVFAGYAYLALALLIVAVPVIRREAR